MSKRVILAPEASQKKSEFEEGDAFPDEKSIAHENALRKKQAKDDAYRLNKWCTLSDQIAQDSVCFKYVKFPKADELYPETKDAMFRFVDKYYPNAVGGPLYVDEPRGEVQVLRAYARQKILKRQGLRYIVIEKDTKYEHCLEQLGEL